MVFTPTTTSTTQLIVTPPTTVMQANWQEWGYKSWQDCVYKEGYYSGRLEAAQYARKYCAKEARN